MVENGVLCAWPPDKMSEVAREVCRWCESCKSREM